MNYFMVISVLGILLIIEAIGMIPPSLISLYYKENDLSTFLITIVITLIFGLAMYKVPIKRRSIKAKEAVCIVSIGWMLISFFGAFPLFLSGSVPSFVDAFFEMVSGFTTTGSTVINNIVLLPKGILFWRSFSHWIGGMGILVFTIALLPTLGIGGFQIYKAESPGPTTDRITPRVKDTAKILYTIYIAFTFVEIILLKLGGMDFYEAIIHTFGTIGTGGVSTRSSSIGAFHSTYINVVISILMILTGINFSAHYDVLKGRWRDVLKNEELKLYLSMIGVSSILITMNLGKNTYESIGRALEHALFQVSSIISTTGYMTVDYDMWPTFSKAILFALMFTGGCAGSISGGIKSIRILVLFRLIKREIAKIFHPWAVIPVKVNGKSLSSDVLARIMSFFAAYIGIFVLSTILLSLEGIDLVSASSIVASSMGNIGVDFATLGPTKTLYSLSATSKLFLSFLMLLGRLEIFTFLVLFSPKFWKSEL